MTPSAQHAPRAAAAAPASHGAGAARAAQAAAWPAVRAGSRRLFAVMLLVAFVAHLPALPFDPVFMARLFFRSPPAAPPDPEPAEILVPVDLDLLDDAPGTEETPAAGAAATGEPAPPPAPEPAAEPAPTPAADPAPAKPPPAASKTEDIYEELDKPKRGTPRTNDPLTVAGGPGKLGPKAAHVQVLFNGNRLRGNTAGAALGGVLTALPEWKTFFEGTKIDPIADAEHLLIAGPRFRRSREVVVWMEYRVSEKEMREAIDTLVKRSRRRGRWLEDAPVPAAIAVAHHNRRIFALVPGKKLLAILPLSAKDQLPKLKTVRPFNATSKAGIVIALATPRNAFTGYEDVVDVPETFKWMRMVVTPLADGDASVTLEIGDASAEDAAKHAPLVEKQLDQVRTLAKIATVIGADVLPPMKVEVDNDILRVNATVSRKGLNHILNLARTHFAKKAAAEPTLDDDVYDDEEPGEKKKKKEKGAEAPGPADGEPVSPSPSPTQAAPSLSLPDPSESPSAAPAPDGSAEPKPRKKVRRGPRIRFTKPPPG